MLNEPQGAPVTQTPQANTPGELNELQMLERLMSLRQPTTEEPISPEVAITEHIARQELREGLRSEWEITHEQFTAMTRKEFNELKLAEFEGNIEQANRIRIEAVKRGLELDTQKRGKELKGLHTEGGGQNAADVPVPTTFNEIRSQGKLLG